MVAQAGEAGSNRYTLLYYIKAEALAYEHSFRYRVVTGSFTLPVAVLLSAILWMASDPTSPDLAYGLCLAAAVTYCLVELNNRMGLLRLRSRMVSSTFALLMGALPLFHAWSPSLLPTLCLALAYFPLFGSYQKSRSSGDAFRVGLIVAVGSFAYPPFLLLLPVMLLGMAIPLRSLGWRSLLGGIIGGFAPFWCYAGWAVWQDDAASRFAPFTEAFKFSVPSYAALPLPLIVAFGFVFLLTLLSAIHYFRTAYNDKIRTRMFYDVIIMNEVLIVAGLVLLPSDSDALFPLFVMNSSPLIAHYLSLARGRFMNLWFVAWLVLLCVVAVVLRLPGWTLS